MKKNIKIILGVMVFGLLSSGLYLQITKADSVFKDCADTLKEEIKQKKSKDDSSIIIQGKNFVITEKEKELKVESYKLKGDKNPEEAAIKHLIERKVLLNKALEMGYSITEEEIDKQTSLVKEAVKTTENYNDYLNYINEYGGEDAYWADIRDTTRDTMIINKYLDYEKEKYNRDNLDNQVVQFDSNLLDGWNKQKEEIINNLVKDQDITILDSKYDNLALTW